MVGRVWLDWVTGFVSSRGSPSSYFRTV